MEDTLGKLVPCERCEHGATLHGGDGCLIFRCRCTATRQDVVEDALATARIEIRAQWLPKAK